MERVDRAIYGVISAINAGADVSELAPYFRCIFGEIRGKRIDALTVAVFINGLSYEQKLCFIRALDDYLTLGMSNLMRSIDNEK